jgi:hypothetical protein
MKSFEHFGELLGKYFSDKNSDKCTLRLTRHNSIGGLMEDLTPLIKTQNEFDDYYYDEMTDAINEIYKFLKIDKKWEIQTHCSINGNHSLQGCIQFTYGNKHVMTLNLNNQEEDALYCKKAIPNHVTTILHELVHALSGQFAYDYRVERGEGPRQPTTEADLFDLIIKERDNHDELVKQDQKEIRAFLLIYGYEKNMIYSEVLSRVAVKSFLHDPSALQHWFEKDLTDDNRNTLCKSYKKMKKYSDGKLPIFLSKFKITFSTGKYCKI